MSRTPCSSWLTIIANFSTVVPASTRSLSNRLISSKRPSQVARGTSPSTRATSTSS